MDSRTTTVKPEQEPTTMPDEHAFIASPTRELNLPVDTFPITATGEPAFFLTPNGHGKLIPQLALHTEELGWYRITFAADTFKALLAQAAGLANMTPEQAQSIADQLHSDDAS
ncbi:hypothetical protein AO501_09520 [Mycobacterium gordonae]|uniref:Uncharacterized protein n=1 Tax=Mycobacterium gordonae TaxID=1778 RepID=A0A0Q2RLF6_MYCGO|nr:MULTISPECIES: hypothetical protein [Mycobacterium]KQH76243.1 hypothetical protein AO501_09520 [Mycobacterium gordonae]